MIDGGAGGGGGGSGAGSCGGGVRDDVDGLISHRFTVAVVNCVIIPLDDAFANG